MSKSKKAGTPPPKASKRSPGLPSNPRHLADIMTKMADLAELVGIEDFDGLDDDDGFDGLPDERLEITVKRLPHGESLPLPAYQTEGASGVDLCAAVPADSPLTLAPGARALVPTGIAMQIPLGIEGQIRPRSGLAFKHGVTVLNAPGTIDADYRGEIGVVLINHGADPFTVARGDRIAQLVFAIVVPAAFVEEAMLVETKRGAGGFGSTGKRAQKG